MSDTSLTRYDMSIERDFMLNTRDTYIARDAQTELLVTRSDYMKRGWKRAD